MRARLQTVVEIYEHVHATCPVTTKAQKNKYWDLANFTAYIAHSLTLTPEKEPVYAIPSVEEEMDVWYTFIVEQRAHPEIINVRLRADLPGGRGSGGHWTWDRWHKGWRRMFHPESFAVGVMNPEEVPESDETDEE